MSDLSESEIVHRLRLQQTLRKNIEAEWNDVDQYVMPLRLGQMYASNTAAPEQGIQWERDDIYDTTAITSSQKMAASLHGTITDQRVKWFWYDFKTKELNSDPESRAWLDECSARVYSELYESNFDSEMSSFYQDLVGPGNACLSCEAENEDHKEWKGFNFSCIPLKEFFFEQDHRGDLNKLFRVLSWTAVQIQSKFPNIKLPEIIEKALSEPGLSDQRFEVCFCVYERPENKKNTSFPLAPELRPVGWKYVLTADQTLLANGGYYEHPAYVTRWEKTSQSAWGFGPGMLIAPTAKYLNNWMQMEQMALRKLLDPANLATERGLLSDLNMTPGGLTIVRDLEKSLKPYESGARIDLSKLNKEELRMMIRIVFKDDELQMKDSPQMSATEAQIRYELMNRVLGPTLSRIQNDALSPLLDRMFKTLLRNNQLPPTPVKVRQMNAQLKVVYSGPLVRSQKSDEVASIERFIGQIGAIAKVIPEVLNVLDIEAVARAMAVRLGVPGEILRSKDAVAKMREAQQKTQAMAQKAQLAQEGGQGAQELAKGQQAMSGGQNGQQTPQ